MSTADMFERRWLSDWGTMGEVQYDIAEALTSRGATYCRLSFKPFSQEVIGEGWLHPPDDQGDLPV